jgi:hypothetical protein
MYGHYAVIIEGNISFYRYPIREFSITDQEGKEKWTAYQFTRNLYDSFVTIHLERICSAVDELPNPDRFLVEQLSQQSESQEAQSEQSSLSNNVTSGMENFEIGSTSSSSQGK